MAPPASIRAAGLDPRLGLGKFAHAGLDALDLGRGNRFRLQQQAREGRQCRIGRLVQPPDDRFGVGNEPGWTRSSSPCRIVWGVAVGYIGHMEKATISQLKNRLSAYLKKVRAGDSILILDRDQPIARIERVAPLEGPEDRLTRLERSGLLQRSTTRVSVEELRAPVPRPERSVVEALIEERREGR